MIRNFKLTGFLIILFTLSILVGCTTEKVWIGESKHWKATFKNDGEYTIQYIGSEKLLNKFSYRFITDNNLEVFGNMNTLSPKKQIKAAVIIDDAVSNETINLIVHWNDQEEKITLQK